MEKLGLINGITKIIEFSSIFFGGKHLELHNFKPSIGLCKWPPGKLLVSQEWPATVNEKNPQEVMKPKKVQPAITWFVDGMKGKFANKNSCQKIQLGPYDPQSSSLSASTASWRWPSERLFRWLKHWIVCFEGSLRVIFPSKVANVNGTLF